jgi:Hypothetical glycosyl hydrolase family 15
MLHRIIRALRFAVAILLAIVVTLAADPALPQDFPRLSLYGSMYGDGYPLLDAAGNLDQVNLDRIARYEVVTLDASPISPYRPDVAAALRARNPNIELLAYVNGHYTWNPSDPDSLNHYPTRYKRLVRDLNGYLYNQYGELYGTRVQNFANVNLAKRDASGRLVVAEGLANLFYDAIVKTGTWDGIFIDTYCDNIDWTQSPSETIDYQRAGYSDWNSFAASWRAGADTLASRLRALSGPSFILVGNCATGSKYAWFNGWMRENFPFQNGGDWFQNMFRDPGGYFVDEARHLAPTHNYIFSAVAAGTDPYSANNSRVERFGLGSASLGSGFGVIGVPERQAKLEPYHEWWYDEYAVDLSTGSASSQLQHTGWLGAPLGPAYQMVWIGGNPDAVPNPDVETDLAGWSLSTNIGSTLSRDTATAGSGSASIFVTVPTTGSVTWATNLRAGGSISVIQGFQYAATFWAKSSRARSARVAAGKAVGGGEFGSASFDLTTSWKRYQVVIIPNGSGTAEIQFHLAGEPGDVWLDDVHLQQGVTSLWRRDFQNGIVLVNPAAQSLTVPLEREFRRITGVSDPLTNNGAIVTQVTVPASDARFLIGDDQIAPEAINDLRPIPPGAPGIP